MKKITFLLVSALLAAPLFSQLKLDREPPRIQLQTIETPGFGGYYSIAPIPREDGLSCRERTFIGAMIGLSLFTDVPDENGWWSYRTGLAVSLMALYELNPRLALLGTIGLLQMGYSESYLDFVYKWRRNYLAVGLLAGYMLPIQSVQLAVLLGPMLGYWMSTNYLFIDKVSGERDRQKEPFVDNTSVQVNRFLFGVAGGLMLRTKCGPGSVMAMALLSYAITPHKKYLIDSFTRHNLGFVVAAGYAIRLSQICRGGNTIPSEERAGQ